MNEFAKIFNHKEHGQMLAVKDLDDKGAPMLRFMVSYGDTMITHGMVFKDNQNGWDLLHEVFDQLDEERAFDLAESTVKIHIARKNEIESEAENGAIH
ncbi:hypothetical protein AB832_08335 [Flavobacteriaceae bacterium (ex Bugula neritina AB1)]|nr:hypothetical protein AB832_08335 [Flavobacteriaceae bacterium (ex Bugula neritina AB1)]